MATFLAHRSGGTAVSSRRIDLNALSSVATNPRGVHALLIQIDGANHCPQHFYVNAIYSSPLARQVIWSHFYQASQCVSSFWLVFWLCSYFLHRILLAVRPSSAFYLIIGLSGEPSMIRMSPGRATRL